MTEQVKKTKILALGDCLAFNTGVGLQSRYVMRGLVDTGRYTVLQLAGAKDHPDYRTQQYSEDIIIKPVKGYGNKMEMRQALDQYKPDAVWFITDPRFYMWLFEMADEITSQCPLFYWHVWDNDPPPKFNKPLYDSCTFVGCISQLTYKLTKELGHPNVEYIPHAVPRDIFKPEPERKQELRRKFFQDKNMSDKFILLWIGVNARRKRIGDMILAFNNILVEHPDTVLVMKTKVHTKESINPAQMIEDLQLTNIKINDNLFLLEQVQAKNKKGEAITRDLHEPEIAELYNMSDLLVNNSSHEGFGLSVLQALYTGTPPFIQATGGMTGQLKDEDETKCGFPTDPTARSIMGDMIVPYIYEDFMSAQDIVKNISTIISTHKRDPEFLKKESARCVERSKMFSIKKMIQQWDDAIQQNLGSTHKRFSVQTY